MCTKKHKCHSLTSIAIGMVFNGSILDSPSVKTTAIFGTFSLSPNSELNSWSLAMRRASWVLVLPRVKGRMSMACSTSWVVVYWSRENRITALSLKDIRPTLLPPSVIITICCEPVYLVHGIKITCVQLLSDWWCHAVELFRTSCAPGDISSSLTMAWMNCVTRPKRSRRILPEVSTIKAISSAPSHPVISIDSVIRYIPRSLKVEVINA